ncbi:MAG: hypothetical protein M0041_03425 [Nitrospiraceae bacterium]|nr:hypothetical protein [Nitrospiraceae bacterium]
MNKTMLNGLKKQDDNVTRFVTPDEFEDYIDAGWERQPNLKAIPDKVTDQMIPVRIDKEGYKKWQYEEQGGRQTELQVKNMEKERQAYNLKSGAPEQAGVEIEPLYRDAKDRKEREEELSRKAAERSPRGKPTSISLS